MPVRPGQAQRIKSPTESNLVKLKGLIDQIIKADPRVDKRKIDICNGFDILGRHEVRISERAGEEGD